MKNETIKGFRDYSESDAERRSLIKEILRGIFERYGFEPAETPIIERESFVKSSASEEDEAISDIYKLKDKGKRKLALRYEFTFQLKRLAKNKKLPYKRYQIGPVFRDEPVKGNRMRQFIACEADIVGISEKPARDEAELISMINGVLKRLKVPSKIYVNNRRLLNEILESEGIKKKNFEKIIRELDKLDKISKKEIRKNLKKYKADKILDIFNEKESFFKKYKSYSEIEELKKYCRLYGIKIVFAPYLARGLSYYTGNVFEVKSDKIEETICGGGEYEVDGIKSFGFGVSIERLDAVSNIKLNLDKFLIVSLNQDLEAIKIANELRKKGRIAIVYYGKPSKALQYANSKGISKTIFVGAKEVKNKKFKLKDMETGKEKPVTLKQIKRKNILFKRKNKL